MIKALSNAEEKKTVARQILEALPECLGFQNLRRTIFHKAQSK